MKKRMNKKEEQKESKQKEPKQKKHILLKAITFIIIFCFALLYYMRFVETNKLSVKEIKIESTKIPESLSGLKIAHISDLYYKSTIDKNFLKKLTKKINKLKPDILVFTGDLTTSDIKYTQEDYEDLIYYLKKINANNKYYIKGDNDYNDNNISNILESSGFLSLNNKEDYIYGSDNYKIVIHGLGSFLKNDFDTNSAFISNDNTLFNVVLFHEADNILELQDKHIDLALAGHSLNNQIDLPIIKKLLYVEGAKDYYDDYYNVNGTHLYVNAGLGTNNSKLRLFNPPTINFYRLVKKH